MAGAKLVFGYATGAVSMISDGFHSLTDSASNVMGMIGLHAARKPPDQDHPYGHRKYETLAAGGIFVFLLFVVIEVLEGALDRLGRGAVPRVTATSFLVMLGTIAINLFVVRYESARGKALNSELLLADSMHTKSDVFTSCAVLISLAAVQAGARQGDFPVVVLLRPPAGHGLGTADAGAIGTAKAIPRRLVGGGGQDGQETDSDDGQNATDHGSSTPKR